ncbi:phosphatases II [Aulographum hederae CBS 113979]|uniref:phosphatidylinositol-3,4,5-trisphosphate 3-phosphatase n=1 Tax=Aulographum hederae CBS 113979 TaxID=1176131 RepID=A0A6G1HH56_9PEZI|nr:phosphatases II [Aulographum hederae CBS 113979]
MASLLRQIVAGPRIRHQDAGLDLCYVTDNIIATSGPSGTYPQRYYRNPLSSLVKFLDKHHGEDWAIWEFRAEGTGYPDEAVYHRIWHYPFPDHHPPPFAMMPVLLGSMRRWLEGEDILEGKVRKGGKEVEGKDGDAAANGDGEKSENKKEPNTVEKKKSKESEKSIEGSKKEKKRVVVVHCKAGKGRSGTATVSYLIAEEGWSRADALARFTERRMRPNFGPGVSIPSQLRWVGYVDRWANVGKKVYIERPVEVREIRIWGLRDGVKLGVEGFVEEGKVIKSFYTFSNEERIFIRGDVVTSGFADTVAEVMGRGGVGSKAGSKANSTSSTPARSGTPAQQPKDKDADVDTTIASKTLSELSLNSPPSGSSQKKTSTEDTPTETYLNYNTASPSSDTSPTLPDPSTTKLDAANEVIFRTSSGAPISLPTSDINIAIERRNRALDSLPSYTVVTAVAHVWFNIFFEGRGPENQSLMPPRGPELEGSFEIDWDALDGIKGSSRKGGRGFDRMQVRWAVKGAGEEGLEKVIREPGRGEEVKEARAADWRLSSEEMPEGVEGKKEPTGIVGAVGKLKEKEKVKDEDEDSLAAVKSHIEDN